MKHIFISYSRKNSEYTHRLRDALTSRNLPVWIDEHIPVGAVWPQEIHKAIGDSFAVIVLMTPDSMQSRWVQKEVLWAGQKEILTMPLLVEDCDFFGLHDIQYVDVRHGGLPPEDFFRRLQQLLEAISNDSVDPAEENLRLKDYVSTLEDKVYELEERLDEIRRREEHAAIEMMHMEDLYDSLRGR